VGCIKVLRVEFLWIGLIGLLRCLEGASVHNVLGVPNIGCKESNISCGVCVLIRLLWRLKWSFRVGLNSLLGVF